MTARRRLFPAVFLALITATALAQETGSAAPDAAPEKDAWEFNASVYGYFPPDDRLYAQPTVLADRGALHLEARYNYEGFKTGSVWAGWNLEAGEKLKLEATLLAGAVFGDTRGAA